MTTLSRISRLAAGLLILALDPVWGQFLAPVIEKKVDPVYPSEIKAFTVEPAKVEIVIDDTGKPFALKASTGLPDFIVQALAAWRFHPARDNGKPVGASISLVVPIKRPMEGSGRMARARWSPSKGDADVFEAGQNLDAVGGAKVEATLRQNPDERDSRIMLLAYAARLGEEGAKLRLEESMWLAQKDPDNALLSGPVAAIPGSTSTAGEAYQQLRQLWRNALTENPKNPVILSNATNFLRFSDPEVVENAALQAVREDDKAAVVLGDLYGLAVLGVTAVDPVHGFATKAGERISATPFAEKARATLMATDDLRVLFAGLTTVRDSDASLAVTAHEPAGSADFCGELLARAEAFYPDTTLACDRALPSPGVSAIRVGGAMHAAQLLKEVRPEYPPAARQRGIQGTVRFNALIAENGSLQRVELLSGPLILYPAAREAVEEWKYKPTTLNDKPVRVWTTIDVNFTIGQPGRTD